MTLPISQATPFYSTELGSAFLGDSLELLPKVATASIDLICTSPPFALLRQKQYGNVSSHEYKDDNGIGGRTVCTV